MTSQETGSIEYVTGSEAGIIGAEQIRIAIDVIIKQGEFAKMTHINKAVEQAVIAQNANYRLSEQGKRAFGNSLPSCYHVCFLH